MKTLNEILTVVIPTIPERSDLLEQAIASVHGQTVGQPEVMWALDENRIGPALVRNSIVKSVKTPWVLFLDDDDVLHPDYLEAVLPWFFGEYGVVYTWCDTEGFEAYLDRPFNEVELRCYNYIPVTACVRTDLFIQAGGFRTEVAFEDWGLWLNLLKLGTKFKCVPKHKWTYRLQPDSRTHANNRDTAAGLVKPV